MDESARIPASLKIFHLPKIVDNLKRSIREKAKNFPKNLIIGSDKNTINQNQI